MSLPCTYPSETAPTFTLSCDWLNESQLAELCLELDKIWQDNANMPVIFTWSEWLSANLVEFLDMAVEPATVIITPLACLKFNKGAGIKDERAISLFSNADDLIYKFLRLVVVRKWVGFTHEYLPFKTITGPEFWTIICASFNLIRVRVKLNFTWSIRKLTCKRNFLKWGKFER